jgi:hypothetical protein
LFVTSGADSMASSKSGTSSGTGERMAAKEGRDVAIMMETLMKDGAMLDALMNSRP